MKRHWVDEWFDSLSEEEFYSLLEQVGFPLRDGTGKVRIGGVVVTEEDLPPISEPTYLIHAEIRVKQDFTYRFEIVRPVESYPLAC